MTCARREAGARTPAPSTPARSPRKADTRTGRARLLGLLPALALLLGALGLFAPAPAHAQAPANPTNFQVEVTAVGAWTATWTRSASADSYRVDQQHGCSGSYQTATVNGGATETYSSSGFGAALWCFRIQACASGSCSAGTQWVRAPLDQTGTYPPSQSNDATLSGLTATSSDSASGTFSALTLTPVFAAATTGYSASVANSVTHVKVTPTVNHAGASVEVGKQGEALTAVSSGTASAAIALGVGANRINVDVTAQDGTTLVTYTVTVTRAAALPGAPTIDELVPRHTAMTVFFSAPASDGGSAITRYEIHYKTNSAPDAPGSGSDPATGWVQHGTYTPTLFNFYDFAGMTNGTTYNVRVRARNAVGDGPWSATATATPADAPAAPTALMLTAGDTQLSATWTAPADPAGAPVTSYQVHYKTNAATDRDGTAGDPTSGWIDDNVSITGTTATITNLTNGTAYNVRVGAVNRIGRGSWSVPKTGTPAAAGLAAPGSFALTAGDGQFTVSWAVVASANSYDIEVKRTGGTSSVTVTPGSATSTTISSLGFNSVANGTTYTVRMRACTGSNPFAQDAGCGAWTATKTVTPQSPTLPVPLNLSVTPGAHSDGTPKLTVTAAAPSALTGTHAVAVQVKAATATSWPARGTDAPSGLPTGASKVLNDDVYYGFSPGTTYDVRAHLVDATDPANIFAVAASTAVIQVTTWNVPGAPTSVDPTAGDASLAVTWAAPTSTGGTGASITGYKVRWRVKDANPNTQGNQPGAWNANDGVDADDSTARTHAISSLTNGKVYEVEVRALNGISPGSAWSAAGEGTPAATTPPPSGAVWSATLTVVATDTDEFGCDDTSGCNAALTDNSFRVGGADYSFEGIYDNPGGSLVLDLNRQPNNALKALKFCVGTTAYSLSSPFTSLYTFTNVNLSWSAGDTISLSIGSSCAGTTPPATLPVVGFEVLNYSAWEHFGEIGATLTLSSALSQASTVTVSVKAGATASSADYTAPTSFTLPAGKTRVPVAVPVTNDSDEESDESFTLVLSAVQSAPYTVSASAGEATFTIKDSDWSAPTNLTASPGAGKLDLSWTASPDAGTGVGATYTVQHKKSATTGDTVTGDADTGWVETTGVHGHVAFDHRARRRHGLRRAGESVATAGIGRLGDRAGHARGAPAHFGDAERGQREPGRGRHGDGDSGARPAGATGLHGTDYLHLARWRRQLHRQQRRHHGRCKYGHPGGREDGDDHHRHRRRRGRGARGDHRHQLQHRHPLASSTY